MNEKTEAFKTVVSLFEIWNARNTTLWYMGLALILVGFVFNKINVLREKIVIRRISIFLLLSGVICVIMCFITGIGGGIGNGNGIGVGTGDGANANNSSSHIVEEVESIGTAGRQASQTDYLRISIVGHSVYVSGVLCMNREAICEAIDKIYNDNMTVEIEDYYAFRQPYTEVLQALKDCSIKEYRTVQRRFGDDIEEN